ncbi:MAG: acylphosphatase [Anaerolineaceae bacterium]|jgi:acylphosphatase|nr:acylphosphatase [Anaerolineaceae bacterium]MDD4043125.1 acylphosphatase [Anaerolineaceae bacterium]MDD4578107.1 acylphosphatase [Anaerolineaceae bacterium]
MEAENNSELARLQAIISGAVQGVGFRYFTMDAAYELGLTGWVRNLHGRSVEVVAEGEREALEKLIEKLRHGPRSARVDEVRFSWHPYQGEFDRFEVRF